MGAWSGGNGRDGDDDDDENDENRLLRGRPSPSLFAPAPPAATLLSPAKQRLLLPRWRNMPAPSTPRIHAAAASLGGELFVIGGRPGVGAELATVEVWRPPARGGRRLGGGGFGGEDEDELEGDEFDDEEEAEEEEEEEEEEEAFAARRESLGRRRGSAGPPAPRSAAAAASAASTPPLSSSSAAAGAAAAGGHWSRAPSLTSPRTAASAASLAGRIYVIGGQTGARTHGGAEVFDATGGGRWVRLGGGGSGSGTSSRPAPSSSAASAASPSPLSSLPDPHSQLSTPRKYATAVAWGGRIVVLGGTDALRVRLASVEALDPREGRWRQLPPMRVARSGAGAAVSASAGGLLVVAGGTPGGGDGAVDAVEALSPAGVGGGDGGRGRGARSCWEQRAPLGAPRAGLALLPV